MEKRIVECVPNFSEGRNKEIIKSITEAIEAVEGVSLLDVDPGEATNRTVVTFAGEPEAVAEAAFQGIKRASELIDMSRHHGAHPRMGATDVCPFVPVSGITLAECAELARQLGQRVADELGIPVYAYEASALRPERKNLAICRRGEYEGLAERMGGSDGADYGDRAWDEQLARTGATAIGARDFLIAVNFNLNSTSTRRANAIAFDVREKGRPMREGGKLTGKPLKDENGKPLMQPGTLKGTKAIGWYIDEYGIAQVSMNITDTAATPLHEAFAEVCRKADARGVRVTGTEIVGLVPRKALLDAADYFLARQQRSLGIDDDEKIRLAIRSMGLDELKPFVPEEKIIEDVLEARRPQAPRLIDLSAKAFARTTASEAPAPGGGSVAAYLGASAPPSVRWWPTSRPTRPAGTSVGRSSPTSPSRVRRPWRTCCGSLTATQSRSTPSWQPWACPRVVPRSASAATPPSPRPPRKPLRCPTTRCGRPTACSRCSKPWPPRAFRHRLPTPAWAPSPHVPLCAARCSTCRSTPRAYPATPKWRPGLPTRRLSPRKPMPSNKKYSKP